MLNQQFAFDRSLQDKGRLNRDVKPPIARAAAGSEKAAGAAMCGPRRMIMPERAAGLTPGVPADPRCG
ncbi:Phosphotransferase system, mannose/fructose/N -acetylgalactosamine-specific component IIC [Serratia entomophila]|nr:Phosphotransferase system, mannose/fructose/N -acetylgalactosamine-specific component IIC [Serratia entomophila]